MEITTFLFAGFVLVAVLGYRLLPARFKTAWLLLASAAFVVTWSWKFLIVLLALAGLNYLLGRAIGAGRGGSRLLWAGIAINVLALLIFKYNGFYLPELLAFLGRLGVQTTAGALQLLEPLGLSFLSVQSIAYLVDVFYRRVPAEKNFVRFGVFTLYFPKILAGPIERAKTFLPRLEAPENWSAEAFERNLSLVVVGLVRKLILADSLNALIPVDAFQKPQLYPGPALALWLLAYAFALYNDFAGYTLIVRGVSGFFGIELTENFDFPYFARSFSEFWNRWHISLSNWLRDYIYFPLSRSLLRKIPRRDALIHLVLPPLVTMLVSGLWHGFAWNTFLWGGLQGGFLVLERLASLGRPRRPLDELPRWQQFLSGLGVFVCVALAWVPFHTGVRLSVRYWLSMVGIVRWPTSYDGLNLLPIPLLLLLALGLDLFQHRHSLRFLQWPRWQQAALLALVAIVLFLLAFAEKGAPFIYQSF